MSNATTTLPAPPRAKEAARPAPRQEELHPYRLSMEQYRKLAEAGVLGPKDRVFLLDGILVGKMTKFPPHNVSMGKVCLAFRNLPAGWHLLPECPVELMGRPSVPEPDIAVLRGVPDDYDTRLPTQHDVGLLIEVAESSLHADQTTMKVAYARAGIPTYWIINLVEARVEVYTEPTGDVPEPDYARCEQFGPEASVPLVLEGREVARIAVRDLLPPSVVRRAETPEL